MNPIFTGSASLIIHDDTQDAVRRVGVSATVWQDDDRWFGILIAPHDDGLGAVLADPSGMVELGFVGGIGVIGIDSLGGDGDGALRVEFTGTSVIEQ